MTTETLLPLLRSIGLLDSEATLYLTSLQTGSASPQTLAEKSGFSRPATYAAIEALVKKGLLSSVVKGKRLLYSAEPPERLVAFGHAQVKDLQEKVEEIQRQAQALANLRQGERPAVRFYEGLEGLRAIVQDIIDSEASETFEIADLTAVRRVLTEEEINEIQKVYIKVKSKGRALLVGAKSSRKGVEARALPPETNLSSGDIVIYGNKVASVSFEGGVSGVIMENASLAQTYKTFFDLAWKGAANYPTLPSRE